MTDPKPVQTPSAPAETAIGQPGSVEAISRLRRTVDDGTRLDWYRHEVLIADLAAALCALDEQAATIREAVKVMEPSAEHSDDDPDVTRVRRMMFAPIGDLRALAAFVSKHKEPTDAR